MERTLKKGNMADRKEQAPRRGNDEELRRGFAAKGVEMRGKWGERFEEVLTSEAIEFVVEMEKVFGPRVNELLLKRVQKQREIDGGAVPSFLEETRWIREGEWQIAEAPDDLRDRRVEVTGPVDRKMIINGLNSGANVFMADFEDSLSPTWENVVNGQINLMDAIRREIEYVSPEGKEYRLNEKTVVLMVRPRGWHMIEDHVWMEGRPMRATLFDFGLYMLLNGRELVESERGAYFYLPKLQSHDEARLWNDIFKWTEDRLETERGVIKATVLIEHVLAAFEMDEILWELREHSLGLNCGRWDYIFSLIKTFRNNSEMVLPDRSEVTMKASFMEAYVRKLIEVCHRRGAHAMGGMAAQIPIKGDFQANEMAMEKVREDKRREVALGLDGTWVAHPGLVVLAKEIFEKGLDGKPNQIERRGQNVVIEKELLQMDKGRVTEAGIRRNINVGLLYLESWLSGNGCVPLYNLMEDAATAEICRVQLWQWLRHGATLADGRKMERDLFENIFEEEVDRLIEEKGERGELLEAVEIFYNLTMKESLEEFLTLPAYYYLRKKEDEQIGND